MLVVGDDFRIRMRARTTNICAAKLEPESNIVRSHSQMMRDPSLLFTRALNVQWLPSIAENNRYACIERCRKLPPAVTSPEVLRDWASQDCWWARTEKRKAFSSRAKGETFVATIWSSFPGRDVR